VKKIFITIACLFLLLNFASAQDTNLYEKKEFIQNGDTMPYRILLPLHFDKNKKYPIVFFLHGAGERGNDNEKQLVHGGSIFLADSIREKYPAIIVFPQCAANSFWANVDFHFDTTTRKGVILFKKDSEPTTSMKLAVALFKNIGSTYRLDKSKLYIGGLSMGGMGTFEMVKRMPGTFAAAFAICGGADTSTAKQLTETAWWIFHGLKDNVVDPIFSQNMATALKENGAEVRLTLYPEDGHDSWDDAFKEPEFFSWIFAHHK
jgi:predicted peptidase